jgi:hypothetical protein
MKQILIFVLIISSLKSFAQTNEATAFTKVKLLFNKAISCIPKTTQCSIFYNSDQRQFDIDNTLIFLLQVKLQYEYNEAIPNRFHYVKFECLEGNCIISSSDKRLIHSTAMPFVSKKDCYSFIEAVSDLKKIILKENN